MERKVKNTKKVGRPRSKGAANDKLLHGHAYGKELKDYYDLVAFLQSSLPNRV